MKFRHQHALAIALLLCLAPAGARAETGGPGDKARADLRSQQAPANAADLYRELITPVAGLVERSGQAIETDASAPFFWAAFELFGDWR